ncbi:thermonuclease family protein [Polycladidibacter hongkongensis]|uniref:thermonuclease family protein n=1 Tax=Polycladidibacter hongkongensis TaxID=1647556 RepID=UPI0008313498|nr:hypothetical protein [Pseudovibrio hongkongensis]
MQIGTALVVTAVSVGGLGTLGQLGQGAEPDQLAPQAAVLFAPANTEETPDVLWREATTKRIKAATHMRPVAVPDQFTKKNRGYAGVLQLASLTPAFNQSRQQHQLSTIRRGGYSLSSDAPLRELNSQLHGYLLETTVAIDGRTLLAKDRQYQLAHINVPDVDANCPHGSGGTWPCGLAARAELAALAEGLQLFCLLPARDAAYSPKQPADEQLRVICKRGKKDLSLEMVRRGWATPADGAPRFFEDLSAKARAAFLGQWQFAKPAQKQRQRAQLRLNKFNAGRTPITKPEGAHYVSNDELVERVILNGEELGRLLYGERAKQW